MGGSPANFPFLRAHRVLRNTVVLDRRAALDALAGRAGGRWFAAQNLELFPVKGRGCLSAMDAQALLDVRQERRGQQQRDEPGLLYLQVSLAARNWVRPPAVQQVPLAVLARQQEVSWRALESALALQLAEQQPGYRLAPKQASSGQQAPQLEWPSVGPTGASERQVLRQAAPLAQHAAHLAPREASLLLVLPPAGRAPRQAACAPPWRPHPSLLFLLWQRLPLSLPLRPVPECSYEPFRRHRLGSNSNASSSR